MRVVTHAHIKLRTYFHGSVGGHHEGWNRQRMNGERTKLQALPHPLLWGRHSRRQRPGGVL